MSHYDRGMVTGRLMHGYLSWYSLMRRDSLTHKAIVLVALAWSMSAR